MEPEFDVNERDDWYALREYDDEVCGQCGQLRSVCSNPETQWYPQRSTCWATATRENIYRQWHAKHDKAQPDALGFKPTDGVTLWVATADLTPGDDFL